MNKKNLVIINYKMGNVASVGKAFKKIGANIIISNNKAEIEEAEYIVLPGVGAFRDGIKNLQDLNLVNILNKRVIEDKTPFLGICLGMQLLSKKGYEFGQNKGLGWINGDVVKLRVSDNIRLPHIGWNDIEIKKKNILFKDVIDKNFYFVHSYHLKCVDESVITSTCRYGEEFAASIQKDNIFATQFHPEKSQISGLRVLKNFLDYRNYA